jgi:queuosine precursor transporter
MKTFGYVAAALFLASIPASNWMIGHIGGVCVPHGPCLIPVAPGVLAPSGVLTIGAALVLRDIVQRFLGAWFSVAAILVGAGLSSLVAPTSLVMASATAFIFSELSDLAVFTPLQRRGFGLAVLAAGLVGGVIDSAIFLSLAFHSIALMPGQVIGKAWAVLFALPLIHISRRVARGYGDSNQPDITKSAT